ncbi:MAG: class I SAM-dependent methyltransferase [Flavobacterium sp.]|nr:class I SAM-dependent methyltransferase [Flavobacterium sp.]
MTTKQHFLTVRDHSVSKKEFSLLYDAEYEMLITEPQPNASELPAYYESEDYISHTSNNRSLFEWIYQIVRKYAVNKKVNLLSNREIGRLLDVGCGTGDFLLAAKLKGWDVIGIEPNERARSLATEKGLDFKPDLQSLPDNSIDVVTMWHVLEHVPDYNHQMAELKRVLRPGGSIFIAVPNFKSYDAHFYGKYWAAYDVPRHLWHFSKTSISRICRDSGLMVTQVKPMIFDAFYVSLLSEKYISGQMNFFKGIYVGLISNLKALKTSEYSSHIYIIEEVENAQ